MLRGRIGVRRIDGLGRIEITPAGEPPGDGVARGVLDQVRALVIGDGPAHHPAEALLMTVARNNQPAQIRT
ncbi:hypothetical protein JCM9957A_31000 [Kineosporia succinea]